MQDSKARQQKIEPQSDYQRALTFYKLTEHSFGSDISKLVVTFPPRYANIKNFMVQFEELDDLERLMWCDHNFKEAYQQSLTREGIQTARSIIWFTLNICHYFQIKLKEDYQLMKLIRKIWFDQLTSQREVKQQLKSIFEQMGQVKLNQGKKAIQSVTSSKLNGDKRKKTTNCGCVGKECNIF